MYEDRMTQLVVYFQKVSSRAPQHMNIYLLAKQFYRMQTSRLSRLNLTSPVKSELYGGLEQDKKLILKKVHYLFIVYAAKASRYAFREMSEKCFMELMEDVFEFTSRPLHKNSDSWKKIVTLYHGKGKKTGMVFEEFLKLLPAISCHLSRSNDAQDDLKYLMKQILEVYRKKVSVQIESKYVQFDFNLKKDTLDYITKLADQLFIVYKLYFPQQMTNQSIYQSFDNVMLFFKEFQIYPKIISASQLYLIFLEIINSDVDNMFTWADQQRKRIGEKGSMFTFSKFLDTLVRVGIVGISKLRQVEDPQWWIVRQKQSIKALLEYMENVKVKNKNSKFKQVRFSFILLEQYSSEGEKRSFTQTDKMFEDEKERDFFQLFERMKL